MLILWHIIWWSMEIKGGLLKWEGTADMQCWIEVEI